MTVSTLCLTFHDAEAVAKAIMMIAVSSSKNRVKMLDVCRRAFTVPILDAVHDVRAHRSSSIVRYSTVPAGTGTISITFSLSDKTEITAPAHARLVILDPFIFACFHRGNGRYRNRTTSGKVLW